MNNILLSMPRTSKNGVTLLLAVLFLTAGLSISLGIFYIVLIQLQINRAARESHKAFYAADTAKECAAYYREYIGNSSKRGFWSPDNPCNDSDGNGSDCGLPALAPVCAEFPVCQFITPAGTCGAAGVVYAPGADLAPPDAFGNPTNAQGGTHTYTFHLNPLSGICAKVDIKVLERRIGGQPDTRIITSVDGVSACNRTDAINQRFDECIRSVGGCQ